MAWVWHRYATALVIGACAAGVGACSAAPTTDTTPSPSAASQEQTSTSRASPTPQTGSRDSRATPTSRTSASGGTSTASSTAYPGGTGPTTALAAAGYLHHGRIVLDSLRESATDPDANTGDAGVDSPQPPADETSSDLCRYLFGTPAEVAALTRVPPDVYLTHLSGPHTGTEESDDDADVPSLLVTCVYADTSGPQVVLQVSDGQPVDADLPGYPIIVSGDAGSDGGGSHTVEAVISYRPDRTGPRIAEASARAWLTAALNRVTARR